MADGRVERGSLSYATFWSLQQVLQKSQFSDLMAWIQFVLPLATNVQGSTVQAGVPTAHVGFTPTAHTCANILSLPRATHEIQLPPQERLFEIYDLAFSQPFFGKC